MEATVNVDLKNAIEAAATGRLLGGPLRSKDPIVALSTTLYTVRALEDSNDIVITTADNAVVQLPSAAACPGQKVTLINGAASGAALVSFSPAAADAIIGTVAAVSSGGVVNKDWRNTKATALKGDYTKLVSNGTSWFIVGGVGVWISEA